MREIPILFSGPMVRAILEGRKYQTRRVVKRSYGPEPHRPLDHIAFTGDIRTDLGYTASAGCWWAGFGNPEDPIYFKCPYGGPGDLLWVREAIRATCDRGEQHIAYRADGEDGFEGTWKSAIHMPKWAARIFLEMTGVRVERLQNISEEDAVAEGVYGPPQSEAGWRQYPYESCPLDTARQSFRSLWDSINGKKPGRAWENNPWVWVCEFQRPERTV